jgi:hypothetical protein
MVSYSRPLFSGKIALSCPPNSQSDSDAPARSVSSRSPSASGAVAKPPGAQIRYDTCSFFSKGNPLLTHVNFTADVLVRRRSPSPTHRALQAQEGRPTLCSSSIRTTPRAFECACSSTFLSFPRFHHRRQQCRHCFYSDPFIVLVLSLSFIASIFFLHISAKVIRAFTK